MIKNNSKFIFIISHPRSGTHFTIDSLRINLGSQVNFGNIRPSYSTIENLILPHDPEINEEWIKWINNLDNFLQYWKDLSNFQEITNYLSNDRFTLIASTKI